MEYNDLYSVLPFCITAKKHYGKHTGRVVEGFPYWNEEMMKNCSFYKPSPLRNTEIKTKIEVPEEIKEASGKRFNSNMTNEERRILLLINVSIHKNKE